jgi:N-sulfoglucosamine sulfohydrolase
MILKARVFFCCSAFGLLSGCAFTQTTVDQGTGSAPVRPNILLITADDMNYDSLGVTGCQTSDITPHLDRLASEGMRFTRAHVTIAVCQPCRSVLMTGRYPHNNGAMGFEPIRTDVPTLPEALRQAGYMNGILGKVKHLAPIEKFCWDTVVRPEELGVGRDPSAYYQHAKTFFASAREAGTPFFLMANSHDPHRPFAGSQQEKNRIRRRKVTFPGASRYFKPGEIEVPGFLPDIPDVRQEIAEYYTSVHRCDETVGAILRALEESGYADSTLVMFLSDHGMPLPFAKTNCYLHSTRTPWIVRWPGHVQPGKVDTDHFISGIDFMPTIMAVLNIKPTGCTDGRSFLPVMRGHKQSGRGTVFTVFNQTAAKRDYPMRCIQNDRFGYIYNAWSDGETVFLNESQNGLTFKAMQAAAKGDAEIAARVRLFQYRVPEELYDFECDPDALTNLADDPDHAEVKQRMRGKLARRMADTGDPLLDTFERFQEGEQ